VSGRAPVHIHSHTSHASRAGAHEQHESRAAAPVELTKSGSAF